MPLCGQDGDEMKRNLFLILICLFCAHYRSVSTGEMRIRFSNLTQEKLVTKKNLQVSYTNYADFNIESSNRDRRHYLEGEIKNLKLRSGNKTVFMFGALHVPHPEELGGVIEYYYLFIEIDSFATNDTIFIGTDTIKKLFYYEKAKDVSFTAGVSTNLQGYMIIKRTIGDTLIGYINFEGNAQEYSPGAELSGIKTFSYVSCQVDFKAIKRALKKDSEIITTLILPSDIQIDF